MTRRLTVPDMNLAEPEVPSVNPSVTKNFEGFSFPDQADPSPDGQTRDVAAAKVVFPDQRSPLETSYNTVAKIAPDQASQIIDYANRTGHDRGFVEKNLEEIKRTVEGPDAGMFAEFDAKYPGGSQWLLNPDNMAIAKDDLKNVQQHEQIHQDVTKAQTFFDAIQAGYQSSVTGMTARGRLPDLTLEENSSIMKRVTDHLGFGVGQFVGDLPEMAVGSKIGAATALPLAATLGATGIGAGPAAIIEAVGATGGAFAVPSMMRAIITDHFKNGGKAADLDQVLTRISETLQEGAKGYLTGIATGVAGKFTPKSLGSFAPLASEAVAMTAVGKAIEGETAKPLDYLDSLIFVGGLHGLSSGMSHLGNIAIEKRRTEASKNFFASLDDTVEASKARERLSPAHKELASEIAKNGAVKNVYVPVEKFEEYFQSKGIKPEEFAEKAGITEQYNEAKAAGNEVEIPNPVWVESFIGKEKYSTELRDDVKISRDHLTPNELIEVESQVKTAIQAEEQRAVEEQKAKEVSATSESVGKNIGDQLRNAGVPEAIIPANAQAWEAFFRTAGERLGVDPHELFQKFGVSVKNPAEVPLMQGEEYLQDTRGKIQFGQKETNIVLGKDADASTFLHETGHFYLKAMGDFANIAEAPEQIKQDYSKILNYLGVEEGGVIKTPHHEKFASAIETYFREGKAPTPELKSTFERFKDWLTQIYKNFKINGTELTPEIREVFDRMLATDVELEQAKKDIGYKENEVAILDPENSQRVVSLQEKARSKATEQLFKEQLPETTKEHKKFVAEKRVEAIENANKAVDEFPVFKASSEIQEMLHTKKPTPELANKFLDGKASEQEQFAFENRALENGYDRGDSLAREILVADRNKLREVSVAQIVEREMSKYADMMDTEVIKLKAMEEIHSNRTMEILALERQILKNLQMRDPEIRKEVSKRNALEARLEAQFAKEMAKDILDRKDVKGAGAFRTYITAERKAAERVTAALLKKDYEKATQYKREQLLNHALAAESMRNAKEGAKLIDSNVKLGKNIEKMSLPHAFKRQATLLLERHGLKDPGIKDDLTFKKIAEEMIQKGENPETIASATGYFVDESGNIALEGFQEFVARINDDYRDWSPPPSVMENGIKSYKELSMQEMRDLDKTVKSLVEIGRDYNTLLTVDGKVDIRTAQKTAAESVKKNVGTKYADSMLHGSKFKTKIEQNVSDILNFSILDKTAPYLVHLEAFCTVLDKGDVDGPMHNYLYRVLKRGSDNKLKRQEKVIKEYNEVLNKYADPKDYAKKMKERIYVEEVNRYMDREELIQIASHMGNKVGRNRLLSGGVAGLKEPTEGKLIDMVNRLDKADLELVQARWKYLHEAFWSDVVALDGRTKGTNPKPVEPLSYETIHGAMEGGYAPLGYDFDKSIDAYTTTAEANLNYKNNQGFASAMTNDGHTKSRANYVNKPLRLRDDVIYNHIENVVHDLAYRESIIDVSRFMKGADIKQAIQEATGPGGLKLIDGVIKDTAGVQMKQGIDEIDRAFSQLRTRTGSAVLMFKVKNFFKDLTGNFLLAGAEGGYAKMTKEVSGYVRDREGINNFIDEKSIFMKHKAQFKEKDLVSQEKLWKGEESAMHRWGFFMYQAADEALSRPLWMLTYKENLSQHGDKKSVQIADEAVKRTFGSSDVIDRVGVQRKGGLWDLTTMFMTWSSMMFNRYWKETKLAGMELDGSASSGFKAAKIAAGTFVTVYALPGLVEYMFNEASRNSPPGSQDEKGKKKRLAKQFAMQGASYVWGARDVMGYAVDRLEGYRGSHYSLSPAEDSVKVVLEPALRALEKTGSLLGIGKDTPLTQKDAENAFRAVSRVTGFPQQANDIIFNFYDAVNGPNGPTIKDFATRRTKK